MSSSAGPLNQKPSSSAEPHPLPPGQGAVSKTEMTTKLLVAVLGLRMRRPLLPAYGCRADRVLKQTGRQPCNLSSKPELSTSHSLFSGSLETHGKGRSLVRLTQSL
ncbi:hypothetical protein ACKVWC_000421 [Pyricularia oryzae]